ncbi:MAG TPA: hypothetical protein DD381_09255 [Lentisphaeria bacterium]|nr:MAG: hypothetical protein A2X47_13550 [Lentisphaerae bacterium GWF2_38_69]HBM16510.1 hypothetical protein [Lentisphaeria bacterium]
MELMKSMKLFSVLGISTLFLLNGCYSGKLNSNIKPQENPKLNSPAGKFYVEGISYTNDLKNKREGEYMKDFDKRILPLVRKESVSRYPELFTDDSSDAIPLWVDINQNTNIHTTKTTLWMLCTVMICGLILPLPSDTSENIAIKTGIWNGYNGIKGSSLNKELKIESEAWISLLTPSALISVPGESDFPKKSGTMMFGTKNITDYYESIIAQLIVTTLAGTITEKDPSFWTTSSYLNRTYKAQPLSEIIKTPSTGATEEPF